MKISRLPEVTTRRKYNSLDLIINDHGDIVVGDEDTDENFNLSSEEIKLSESSVGNSSKRKIESVVSSKKKEVLLMKHISLFVKFVLLHFHSNII